MATDATTAQFLCQVTSGDSGEKIAEVQWTITSPQMATTRVTLTQGAFNQITVPPGDPKLCVIVPPSTNTLALTLKGVTGDTGVSIDPNEPTILCLPASASFGITVGAGSNFVCEFNWI